MADGQLKDLHQRFLKSTVPISFEEFIALCPTYKKLLTKSVTDDNLQTLGYEVKDGKYQQTARVNALGTAEQQNSAASLPLYQTALLSIPCVIKGREMTCLCDAGAAINSINLSLVQSLGIPYRPYNRLAIKGVLDGVQRTVGIADRVSIMIGEARIEAPFHVTSGLDQNMILGKPFHHAAQLSLFNFLSGRSDIAVIGQNNILQRLQASSADSSENKTVEHFPHDTSLN